MSDLPEDETFSVLTDSSGFESSEPPVAPDELTMGEDLPDRPVAEPSWKEGSNLDIGQLKIMSYRSKTPN